MHSNNIPPQINPPRIAFVGNIANIGFYLVRFFRKMGADAHLFISHNEINSANPFWKVPGLKKEDVPWVHYYDDAPLEQASKIKKRLNILKQIPRMRQRLKEYDVLVTVGMLNIYGLFTSLPHIAFATGADIKEIAWEKGPKGKLMKQAFKKANLVVGLFDEAYFESVNRFSINNFRIFRYPIDPDKVKFKPFTEKNDGILRIFHPSNLIFTKSHERNVTTKGNDRFLKAFVRYIKAGHKAKLTLLDRGRDAERAKKILKEGNVMDHVDLRPEMNEEELSQQYDECHVVVDQFDLGSWGMITVEGLQKGRPVFLRVNQSLASLRYPELAPFFNTDTEEEIFQALCEAGKDLDVLEKRGQACHEWIKKHHDYKKVAMEWFYWMNLACAKN